MYLIKAQDESFAAVLAEDIEAIDDYPHCDLGDLNHLALSEIHIDYVDWIQGEPLVFEAEGGLSVEEWDVACLAWLLENRARLEEYGVDSTALEKFAQNSPELRLFSVDTF